MKKLVLVICGLLIVPVLLYAQEQPKFLFDKVWPDSSTFYKGLTTGYSYSSGGHGVAVDPFSRVWVQMWGASPTDSVLNGATGTWQKVRLIWHFNPDGTPGPFNGRKFMVKTSGQDTLWNSHVGLGTDKDGNILFSTYHDLYRIDYKTGIATDHIIPKETFGLTAAASDVDGYIYVAHVLPGHPIHVIDGTSFSKIGTVVDTALQFGRTIAVSEDGKDVYMTRYTDNAIVRFHSDFGAFGPYTFADTILKGFATESATRHPKTKRLWFSSGAKGYVGPNAYPGVTTNYLSHAHYEYDPGTGRLVLGFQWKFDWKPSGAVKDSGNTRPRGIAFTPSGDTVYAVIFGTSAIPPVQRFLKNPLDNVTRDDDAVVKGYRLEQNFPNPFNPTTQIRFEIGKAALTTLKVYDMMGREVATLVNQNLDAGVYTASFDASKLSSGTYVYTLTSGDQRLVKKMMLLK